MAATTTTSLHGGLRRRLAAWAALGVLQLLASADAMAQPAPELPAAECDAGAPMPASFARAVLKNADSVVRIISLRAESAEPATPDPTLVPMAGAARASPDNWAAERSSASGFVVDEDGYIASSAHAVRDAQETWVRLRDGSQLRARVVGVDPGLDLVLLQVDTRRRLVAVEAAGREVLPGEWVAALGAPFGFEQSVSAGIVSSAARQVVGDAEMTVLQTDVALNPGSSGGPLFDACGQVVGMSSMIFSPVGIYIGVSFAVPIRPLMRAVRALRDGVPAATLGVQTQTLSPALARAFRLPSRAGAVVVRVEAGRAAEHAGLREGDVVLALAGRAVPSSQALHEAEHSLVPNSPVLVEVWRDGASREVEVRPGADAMPTTPARSDDGASRPARFGLQLAAAPAQGRAAESGVYVAAVSGRALAAGIEQGDRIRAIDGQLVRNVPELDRVLERIARASASVIAVLVVRDGASVYIPVHLKDD